MSGKIANPGPLGLAAFGLTTLILNFVNAEIIPAESIGMVLPMAYFMVVHAKYMPACGK